MVLKTFLLASLCATTLIINPGYKSASLGSASDDGSSWADYYRLQLTPGAKLIRALPNATVELHQGRYLVKEYYYETKMVTSEKTYMDAALKKLTGPLISRTDWGNPLATSTYENGVQTGEALQYNVEKGWLYERYNYVEGKKEGVGTRYDSTGRVELTAHYHLDSLDGAYIAYGPDGSVKLQRVYRNGKLVSGPSEESGDSNEQIPPDYPCNPKHQDKKNCGEHSLLQYLAQNIKYPPDARNLGIQGKALVSFVVEKDGSVSNVLVIRGYCNSIRDECKRVVSGMERWIPGSASGKPVKVRFTLPIGFRLE